MRQETTRPDARHVWTLTKGPLTAACVLRPHPQGEEVLVTIGGVRLYGHAHPDVEQALSECVTMRQRMAARGWVDGAPAGN
jgi:hypothetical protein